ncbi:LysR family transcriptional regulator [Alkaliphilus crotonatoxidans]
MEFRQLQYFRTVCQLNTITRAAEKLHVSQPSITNSIKNLEEELGVRLFDRSKKQLRLTPEGQFFLEHVEGILNSMEDTLAEMQDYKDLKKGTLKIGVPPMIGTFLFPKIFVSFKNCYPEIELVIVEEGSLTTTRMVENEELNLAIIILPESANSLESLLLLKSEMLVCLNKYHPLCEKPQLSMEDIKDEPMIMLKEGFYHRKKIMDYFNSCGIKPNVILSSNQLETIKSVVSKGIGISLLLKEIIENDDRVIGRSLKQTIHIPIGLVWKRNRYLSNASKIFIDFIKDSFIKQD